MKSSYPLILLAALTSLAAAAYAGQPVALLTHAHSHNDYAHKRPLFDALDCGICSIEADIFLVGGRLQVGHTWLDISAERTLESLYLKPLRERVKQNGGRVYPNGPTVTLLIDFKTKAAVTYPALSKVLEKYADMLTSVEGGKVTERAITVILSGEASRKALATMPLRYAMLDGRLGDLDGNVPKHVMPWISESWSKLFTWRGKGPMPDDQRKKLREIVQKIHKAGCKIRFLAAPDLPDVWKEELAAGVDILSVDDHAGVRAFLLKQKAGGLTPGEGTEGVKQ